MTATLKKPRRRPRVLRSAEPDALKFDPAPPIEPPDCLKNRKPGERLTNAEHIEALEWLIECIRESAQKKGLNL